MTGSVYRSAFQGGALKTATGYGGRMGILEFFCVKGLPLAAGFIGALISLKFIEGLNMAQRATTVLAGTFIAAYLTPFTVELAELSPKMEAAVAFLGGLFGMSIAGAAITAIPEWVAAARKMLLGGGS